VKIDLTKWEGRQLDVAGVTVCVALALAVYLGGLRPLRQSHDELAGRREALSVQQTQAARLEAARVAIQHRLDGVRGALAEKPLPLKPVSNMNVHVASISALAVENGLRIDDVQTGSVSEGVYCEAVPIHLAGGGTYRDCTAFLSRLRRAFPDTSVSSLELTGGAADPGAAGRFRVALEWYAAPRAAAAAKRGLPAATEGG
jgi:Tfp pilus assembly protein PilO